MRPERGSYKERISLHRGFRQPIRPDCRHQADRSRERLCPFATRTKVHMEATAVIVRSEQVPG